MQMTKFTMAEQAAPKPQQRKSEYRTGKVLGRGTYSVVKEAFNIETGERLACKVINKKLLEGQENMFENEISVLNQISSSHPNIVTLHDYFETEHNLYLCFELCTGGPLLDVLSRRDRDSDAARLIKTILSTLAYIHEHDIVHGDLKPSNLLFRTTDEAVDIMIADFGLSRTIDDNTLINIGQICGTPGYMAPEIFEKGQYGKPVDVWAMGVITYLILGGHQPFYRRNLESEERAIISRDFHFLPAELWDRVSDQAKDFISQCFTRDPAERPRSRDLLEHPWLREPLEHFQGDPEGVAGQPSDLLPFLQRATMEYSRAAASRRDPQNYSAPAHLSQSASVLLQNLVAYKRESEDEVTQEEAILFRRRSESGFPAMKLDLEGGPAKYKDMKDEDDIALLSQGDADHTSLERQTR